MSELTVADKHVKSLKELYLISIGHGFTHWYPATFYLLLPVIGKELGLSYGQIGFIMTFQFIVTSLFNVPGGMLVDLVRRKGMLMAISLLWVGIPYFLMSFTNSYVMLLLCVALVGMGNNLWHPTAISTLSQRYPERKGFALSIHGMGANIGDALAPLTIGALLGLLGWKQVVVWNIIPGVALAAVVMISLRTLRPPGSVIVSDKKTLSAKGFISDFGQLVKNKSLIFISTSSAFRSMTQNALLTYLPLYLAYSIKLDPFWVGFSMFALQAFGFIAAPISGNLSDRLGRKKIVMTSMLMTGVILVAMGFAGQSNFFVVFIALLGFFLFAVRSVMQAWLMDITPKQMAGTSVGLLFGMQSFGSSISPLVGGLIADRYGLNATFYFIACTIMIANLMVFLIPERAKNSVNNTISG